MFEIIGYFSMTALPAISIGCDAYYSSCFVMNSDKMGLLGRRRDKWVYIWGEKDRYNACVSRQKK